MMACLGRSNRNFLMFRWIEFGMLAKAACHQSQESKPVFEVRRRTNNLQQYLSSRAGSLRDRVDWSKLQPNLLVENCLPAVAHDDGLASFVLLPAYVYVSIMRLCSFPVR